MAVKVLRPELAAVLGTERFLAEIQVTLGLERPVDQRPDAGTAPGSSWELPARRTVLPRVDWFAVAGPRNYDIHPDGRQFSFQRNREVAPRFTLAVNWLAEVESLLAEAAR